MIEVEGQHPLHGAVNKRIGLFQNLAGAVTKGASRPDRVFELPVHEDNYSAMV